MPVIVTPRPPLNLFEAVREEATSAWADIYTVPSYRIPASGPSPQRDINAAAIMNGLLVSNTTGSSIAFSARIVSTDTNTYAILEDAPVPANAFMVIALERQVMLTGETIQVKVGSAQTADVHFSFILNTREEYEVLP